MHDELQRVVLNVLCCLLAIMLRDLVYSWHDGIVEWKKKRNLARCEAEAEAEDDYRE